VAFISDDWLVIRGEIAYVITVIIGVYTIIIIVILFLLPAGGILPRDPVTITGIVALLQYNPTVLDYLGDIRTTNDKSVQRYFLANKAFQS